MEDLHVHRLFCAVGDSQRQVDYRNRRVRPGFRRRAVSVQLPIHYLRRLPAALSYGATLLVEIFKANVTVIKMILDKNFEPKPQLVHFESGLVEMRHRVALADSITLTPGTITCQLEGDHYLVHCLDAAMVDGLDNGVFVEKLTQMEQKQQFMADSVTGEVQPEDEKEKAPAMENEAPAAENESAQDAAKEEEHEH